MKILDNITSIFRSNKSQREVYLENSVKTLTEALQLSKGHANPHELLENKSLLTSIYGKSRDSKKSIIQEVNSYKESYIYSAIISVLVDDAIGESPVTKDIVTLSYRDNEMIDMELKTLQDRVDIDGIVESISEDLVGYGEYIMHVIKDGDGVKAIYDDVSQESTVAVYESLMPKAFLGTKDGRDAQELSKDDYIHFCVGSRKIKIKTTQGLSTEYIRIGRPLFFGASDLVKSLMLLTALYPITYVQKVNGSSIVSISIPETTPVDDAFQICRKYESLLNMAIATDKSTGELSISDVLNTAGKFKVIPAYSEKGVLTNVDPRRSNEKDNSLELIEDLRKSICTTVGIPYSFVFGETTAKKLDTLKTYARYVRRLSSIHKGVASGLLQLVSIHLNAKDIGFKPSNVEVRFRNQLVSVDELDKIEFTDTLIGTLEHLSETINKIALSLKAEVNIEEAQKTFSDMLKIINLDKLFIYKTTSQGGGGKHFYAKREKRKSINN